MSETPKPRYQLRPTRAAYMIDKIVADPDFDPGGDPFWVKAHTYGPFRTREQARQFMLSPSGPLGDRAA